VYGDHPAADTSTRGIFRRKTAESKAEAASLRQRRAVAPLPGAAPIDRRVGRVGGEQRRERREHLAGRGPRLLLLGQAPQAELIQDRRAARVERRGRPRILLQGGEDHRRLRLLPEGARPRQELVEDGPQREEIRSRLEEVAVA